MLKPETTISVSVRGDRVTVRGANTADAEILDLAGTIEPNDHCGAGFYWTASRFGSVVLRQFELTYPSTR